MSLSVPFADLTPEEGGALTLDSMQILGLQLFGGVGKAVFIDDIYFSTASDEEAGGGDSDIISRAISSIRSNKIPSPSRFGAILGALVQHLTSFQITLTMIV